jgi:hypothetical protein
MNREFKLKIQQMKENVRLRENPSIQKHVDFYEQEGPVRNVCFMLLDGYRIFLNYAYLVSGEYLPQQNRVILSFTSHMISLSGIGLEGLYYAFMHHLPKHVRCQDARYNATADDKESIVNDITVTPNQ